MWLMIGYFRDGSKCVGRYSRPCRSVTPSRALTVNGIGGFHPAATRRVTSASSSSRRTRPAASRSTVSGGESGVDRPSTT